MLFWGILTPSPQAMLIILVLGVVLFGKRLPDIAKEIGRGILEFKRGLNEKGERVHERMMEQEKSDKQADLVMDSRNSAAAKFEVSE